MRRVALACLLLASGCSIDEAGLESDSGLSDDSALDGGKKDVTVLDAPEPDAQDEVPAPPTCNPSSAFGNVVQLDANIDTGLYEANPFLTPDELTMFFTRDAGGNRLALYYATRVSRTAAFDPATKLAAISSNQTYDTAPFVDDVLKRLYFSSARNGDNRYHLYRADGDGSPTNWSNVVKLTALDSFDPYADLQMWVAPITGEVWFVSDRTGVLSLWTSPDINTPPTYDAYLAGNWPEKHPMLSPDGLTLYFAQTDVLGYDHVFAAARTTAAMPFVSAAEVSDFDLTGSSSMPGWLSPDGCRMYFTSNRSGNSDIWMASRGN